MLPDIKAFTAALEANPVTKDFATCPAHLGCTPSLLFCSETAKVFL
ncbi:hypothetical protein P6F46_24855 [Bacillus shihchuchen]|uniref:Uncharacterized protein n=1 Tax=Bacillus shihchuchen TaxID=3036942 RepID=A0ABT7KYC2_9BACI|nr:hypothetical protein [Bacillus shihchuchen]